MTLNPASPYGTTKVAAEDLVRRYEGEGRIRGATILRYFSVYGPGQRPDMAYAKFCEALLSGGEITVNGDGSQTRSNTFVDDAARASILAAERQISGVAMNISGSESIHLTDAIDVLARAMGVRPRIHFGPPIDGDQRDTGGVAELALQLLGWRPSISIDEGLRRQALAAADEHRRSTNPPV
jgi:UDP-glucose 4-epimerase